MVSKTLVFTLNPFRSQKTVIITKFSVQFTYLPILYYIVNIRKSYGIHTICICFNLALKSDSYSVCFQPAKKLEIVVTDIRWKPILTWIWSKIDSTVMICCGAEFSGQLSNGPRLELDLESRTVSNGPNQYKVEISVHVPDQKFATVFCPIRSSWLGMGLG